MASTNDPRIAHTISEFLVSGSQANVINYPKLCYTEYHDEMHLPVKNILDDYLWEFKSAAVKCKLSDEEFKKYQYNPKRLSSDIYGTTELYFVILALNNMASVTEFDSKVIWMLSKNNMNDFLSKIYQAEKNYIADYNNRNNSEV